MNSLTALFDWLLTASFRASVLVLVVLAIQWAFRRQLAARARYALWLPVLIVLLTPVLPQSRWSVETVFAAPPAVAQISPVAIDHDPVTLPLDLSPPSLAPTPID
jgi:beta-lactamase regulating signal transducer with metallopeptidase domain